MFTWMHMQDHLNAYARGRQYGKVSRTQHKSRNSRELLVLFLQNKKEWKGTKYSSLTIDSSIKENAFFFLFSSIVFLVWPSSSLSKEKPLGRDRPFEDFFLCYSFSFFSTYSIRGRIFVCLFLILLLIEYLAILAMSCISHRRIRLLWNIIQSCESSSIQCCTRRRRRWSQDPSDGRCRQLGYQSWKQHQQLKFFRFNFFFFDDKHFQTRTVSLKPRRFPGLVTHCSQHRTHHQYQHQRNRTSRKLSYILLQLGWFVSWEVSHHG